MTAHAPTRQAESGRTVAELGAARFQVPPMLGTPAHTHQRPARSTP